MLLVLLVAYAWSLALANTQFHHINRDECQHLTNAYRVAHGEKIYRDFWEHHMSGYYHLIAPLMRVSDRPATLYRLARLVTSVRHYDPGAIVDRIFTEVTEYSQRVPPEDDQTVVVVKRRGPHQEVTPA